MTDDRVQRGMFAVRACLPVLMSTMGMASPRVRIGPTAATLFGVWSVALVLAARLLRESWIRLRRPRVGTVAPVDSPRALDGVVVGR